MSSKKRPTSLDELPFTRHGPVRWFSPRELARAAWYVATSSVFGVFADKREIEAAVTAPPCHDHSAGEELWLDYVSDLGDGFDATYSIAYLLGQPQLELTPGVTAPRGSILVMGGDEVYPTASAAAYENRTKGPYNAALPYADDPPALFAVPGNHDWYDGLTSFLRFFTQGSWVGGWKTAQRRSYFAVKLPQRWWLLGIDIQFESYIDGPQIEYFRAVTEKIGSDSVILCAATPSWVEAGGPTGRAEAYATIDYFITQVLNKDPQQVRLMLAGDSHHYARYNEIDGDRSLITCGGGGAYLSATHGHSDPLTLPPAALHSDEVDPPAGSTYDLITTYPATSDSRKMAWRVFSQLPDATPASLC